MCILQLPLVLHSVSYTSQIHATAVTESLAFNSALHNMRSCVRICYFYSLTYPGNGGGPGSSGLGAMSPNLVGNDKQCIMRYEMPRLNKFSVTAVASSDSSATDRDTRVRCTRTVVNMSTTRLFGPDDVIQVEFISSFFTKKTHGHQHRLLCRPVPRI
jgi:hypothetical protein